MDPRCSMCLNLPQRSYPKTCLLCNITMQRLVCLAEFLDGLRGYGCGRSSPQAAHHWLAYCSCCTCSAQPRTLTVPNADTLDFDCACQIPELLALEKQLPQCALYVCCASLPLPSTMVYVAVFSRPHTGNERAGAACCFNTVAR